MKWKLGNREQVVLVAMLIVMAPILFVIVKNIGHSITIFKQISVLNREAELYQSQIFRDSLLLEKIKSDEGLEEYARENFFMQRRGERVFVMEE